MQLAGITACMDYIFPCGLEAAAVEIMITQDKIDGQVDLTDDALQLRHNIITLRDVARNHHAVGFQGAGLPNPLFPLMCGNRVQVQVGCPNQTHNLGRCWDSSSSSQCLCFVSLFPSEAITFATKMTASRCLAEYWAPKFEVLNDSSGC